MDGWIERIFRSTEILIKSRHTIPPAKRKKFEFQQLQPPCIDKENESSMVGSYDNMRRLVAYLLMMTTTTIDGIQYSYVHEQTWNNY